MSVVEGSLNLGPIGNDKIPSRTPANRGRIFKILLHTLGESSRHHTHALSDSPQGHQDHD